MSKFVIAFIFTFGLLIVGFSTQADAGMSMPPMCSSFEDCTFPVSLCEKETCRCISGYCSEDLCSEPKCVAEYDSRGDCISTNKDRCKFSFPKGQERAECEAAVKDFCDCAVDAGCTDKPNGPPEDE